MDEIDDIIKALDDYMDARLALRLPLDLPPDESSRRRGPKIGTSAEFQRGGQRAELEHQRKNLRAALSYNLALMIEGAKGTTS